MHRPARDQGLQDLRKMATTGRGLRTTSGPIAITGIACRFPGGARTPRSFWEMLCAETDAVSEVPPDRWNVAAYYDPEPGKPGKTCSRWGGFIPGVTEFDPQFFGISPRESPFIDPQQRLLLESAWEAFEDGGEVIGPAGANAGVFVGISTNDFAMIQCTTDPGSVDSYFATGGTMSIAANRISYCLNLHGPSFVVDTACSSSLVALHLACQALSDGHCEMALACGVNVMMSQFPFIAFSAMGMLSPDGRCKAFDASANGFVRGEGVGAVLLKPLDAALASGDRVYAVIRGTGVNQDGRTSGLTVPSMEAQRRLVLQTCAAAGIEPACIRYVEAHGTGTSVGDPVEAAALATALGSGRPEGDPCLIGSVKTNIGHLEAAAGIAGLIKTALVLNHRRIPPSLHFKTPNPKIDFEQWNLRVVNEMTKLTRGRLPALAAVNSFGFGGTNAHAILESPPATPPLPSGGRAPGSVISLSARSPETLAARARDLAALIREGGGSLRDICHTATTRRRIFEHRIAFAGSTGRTLADKLEAYSRDPSGFPSPPVLEKPRTAFVFGGQGPQWHGMGAGLLRREPVFRSAMEACDAALHGITGWSLLSVLSAKDAGRKIGLTEYAQPAIFALQVSLAALWRSWGIEPDAVIGHSVGEIAAAHVAGAFDLAAASLLIAARARAMEEGSTFGKMLAVAMPREMADALAAGSGGTLSVGAVNSPLSITLSGDAEAIDRLADSLKRKGEFHRLVSSSYAFHSAKMDPVRERLIGALAGLAPRPSSIPFVSTVTGDFLDGARLDAEYWWKNVRQSVLFEPGMARLIDRGHNVFLELGPQPVLAGSIRECLRERGAQSAVAGSIRRGRDERVEMLESLGSLAAAGCAVRWGAVFGTGCRCVSLPPYPWHRETYWSESDTSRQYRLEAPHHPLLGRPVKAPNPTWELSLDRRNHPYFNDHRVQGHVVVPAAAFLEITLAVAREVFGPGGVLIEDVDISKALFLPTGDERTVIRIEHDPTDGAVTISSLSGESTWIVHSRSKIHPLRTEPPSLPPDRDEIRARCDVSSDAAEFYRYTTESGMGFGPAFRGVKRVWRRDCEALAKIALPESMMAAAGDYIVHPTLLDSCFQPGLAALPARSYGADEGVFLPTRTDRIEFYRSPKPAGWSHIVFDRIGRSTEGSMVVTDRKGRVCIVGHGMRSQFVEGSARSMEETLHALRWIPRPLLTDPAAPLQPEFLPSPRQLAKQMSSRLRMREPGEPGPARLREAAHGIDALCAGYFSAALRKLAVRSRRGKLPGAKRLMEELEIRPEFEGMVAGCLAHLRKGGDCPGDPCTLWRHLIGSMPGHLAELTLLGCAGESLEAILTGKRDPADRWIPLKKTGALEHLLCSSATFLPIHRALEDAFESVARVLPAGRRIRILEIGAASGGATSRIIPHLPPDRSEFAFAATDPSASGEIEQSLSRHPFARIVRLDLREDPATQGFQAHGFDVLVLSDCLAAFPDTRRALVHARSLLAPGGILLLAGLERTSLFFDFVLDPRTGISADARGGHEPLAPAMNETLDRLRAAGFNSVAVASSPKACFLGKPFIIAARAPSACGIRTAPAARGDEREWILFADRGGTGLRLAGALRDRGQRCVTILAGKGAVRVGEDCFEAAPEHPETVMKWVAPLLEEGVPKGVVYLWGLDTAVSESTPAEDLLRSQDLGCIGVLHALRAIVSAGGPPHPQICLVTRGAQPACNGSSPVNLAQCTTVGMARVIQSEYPEFRCRSIDLDGSDAADDIANLLAEITSGSDEEEVAFRGGARFVQRIVPGSIEQSAPSSPEADGAGFALEISRPGSPDHLVVRPARRRKPGRGEVEIEVEAAGINFRDLMKVLGIYPAEAEDASRLGDECSGRISAVGAGVRDFKVGDPVMTFGQGCFASHLVVPAIAAMRKPGRLTFEEAATMLVAYSTAYHALHHLGKMRAGERVLIHAAAGGVGLAAVHLAHRAGVEIFATAGSTAKRAFLRALGVPHVMDSRTLHFAEEIREITRGEGVDLVLNSLAGEAIGRSLSVLRSHGRFLEIGKRDIYQDSKIGLWPFRKNISFFAVDLSQAIRPGTGAEILPAIRKTFDARALPPLPYRTFPLRNADEAFRHMSMARQIGKIVLSVRGERVVPRSRPDPTALAFDKDHTYLITGGCGGFGLATAQWLAIRGARQIALLGLRGVTSDEARRAIRRLRKAGVRVVVLRADVSDERDLAGALRRIARSMPPLRGIIHAAMVIDDGMLGSLTAERFHRVLSPKMIGAWNLHRLTADLPLDFFVMYSSGAGVVGNVGQGNYACANVFLDALAHYRRARGLPALSVDWGLISEVGYAARHKKVHEFVTNMGWAGMNPREATRILGRLMLAGVPQMLVARINWKKLSTRLAHSPRYSEIGNDLAGPPGETSDIEWIRDAIGRADPSEGRKMIENYLREQISKVLRIPLAKLDTDRPLNELGMDSLMAVELINRLESQLTISIPTGRLMGGPTISKLSAAVYEVMTGSAAPAAEVQSPEDAEAEPDLKNDLYLPEEISRENRSVPPSAFHSPRSIFLSGATGFLNIFLLAELLCKTRATIHCLVGCRDPETGLAAIREEMARYGLKADARRIQPVPGTLAEPGFGLEPALFSELAASCDAIFHSGAEINHVSGYGQLAPANVAGTREAVRFAATGRLKPIHYLSSISVLSAVEQPAPDLIGEDLPLSSPQNLAGAYPQTRWVAEKILGIARARGIPANIFRPGLVSGESIRGTSAPDDFSVRILQTCVALGAGPDMDTDCFLTPVDFVVASVVHLSKAASPAGSNFNLANPHRHSVADLLRFARSFGYDIEILPIKEWEQLLADAATRSGLQPILPYLMFVPAELRNAIHGFEHLPRIGWENARTGLSGSGIQCPPIDDVLLGRYFDFMIRSGVLPPPDNRPR